MTKFNIEVVSDTVCPWCYVGKQQLGKAISAYKELHPKAKDEDFAITWRPFYLAPEAPAKGIDKDSYMKAKFGEARVTMMRERLTQLGKQVDINFKFGGKTGNTRTSHRLIAMAKTKSLAVQNRFVADLLAAYHEDEADITSHAVLTSIAIKAGIEEKEVREWLESDAGGKEVDQEVRNAQQKQISGVPNFTIQGKYEVGGAQDSGVFLRLFEGIRAAENAQV